MMATNPWGLPEPDEQGNLPLPTFFAQPAGLPAPTNYQPDTAAFASLMQTYGGFNPSGTAPTFPDTPAPPDTGLQPPPEPVEGEPPPQQGYRPSPSWGPFSQFGFPFPAPTVDEETGEVTTQNPWDVNFWTVPEGEDAEEYFAPWAAFQSYMMPWLQESQQNYQYQSDFDEAQRRWQIQNQWTQFMDQFQRDLSTRQQNTAETDRALAAQQWMESFQRQGELDQFSQEMALLNYQRLLQDMALRDRQARYQAFGRSQAPGRWTANWG